MNGGVGAEAAETWSEQVAAPDDTERPGARERHEVDVSVLVPVTERAADLGDLYSTYSAPLRERGWSFEFIFALEPYYRDRAGQLAEFIRSGEPIQVLEAGQAVGESSLVKRAADRSCGRALLTLPAYHRVRADVLPDLMATLKTHDVDLVVARRWPRRDSWINRLQTRVFHALLHGISGAELEDVGCGVRAMRREVLDEVPLYGDFYRFFPLLALNEGYRVEEVDSEQHPEDEGPRLYRPGVYLRRLIDLLGVFFLVRFTYKPLRFFGLVGSGVALVGAAILAVLFVQRLGGQGIADRPLLLLGVVLLVLGVQAIALGLIGEIIVHLHAPSRKRYRVKEAAASGEGD